jgi:hypothetical protein
MLGDESEWVKNVRAAGGQARIKRGRRHLPVPHGAPVSAFEAIAADHPVFRIDPAA